MPRGRPHNPKKQEQSRSALLEAARTLLRQKTYKSISIRELAQHADTQPAMISYYFGSKLGLFEELIRQTAAQRQVLLADIAGEALLEPHRTLDILVHRITDVLLTEPWLFRLVLDEVISSEPHLRELFIAELPQRIQAGLTQLLKSLQQKGLIRDDLNLTFFIASLMSLMMFPLLTQPLLDGALGIDHSTIASDEWKQHVSRLLKEGITP